MRTRLGSRGVCSSGLQVFGVLRGLGFYVLGVQGEGFGVVA